MVVAVVLGKGFLENRTPEGTILAQTSNLRGKCSISLVIKRKVIVDDDRVRYTKGVKIHGIDAVGVHFSV